MLCRAELFGAGASFHMQACITVRCLLALGERVLLQARDVRADREECVSDLSCFIFMSI